MSQIGASFGGSFGQQGYATAPAPVNSALISDTTTTTFTQDVLEESKIQPVLVDFWAPWCGPCKQLTPVIEKAVTAAKGKVKLVKMNIDDHPEVAGQLGIQSIPAVVAFVNGQGVDGFMGAVPEKQITAFIEKLTKNIKSQSDELLEVASQTMEMGDFEGAGELFQVVLSQEPDNQKARFGLARCMFEGGNAEGAKEMLIGLENNVEAKAILSAIELAQAAKNLGPTQELLAALELDENNHQARFDLAIALNAQNKRDDATDQLLTLYKRDREWNEGAARAQLLQFFESWGAMDEASRSGRRKLSAILFR